MRPWSGFLILPFLFLRRSVPHAWQLQQAEIPAPPSPTQPPSQGPFAGTFVVPVHHQDILRVQWLVHRPAERIGNGIEEWGQSPTVPQVSSDNGDSSADFGNEDPRRWKLRPHDHPNSADIGPDIQQFAPDGIESGMEVGERIASRTAEVSSTVRSAAAATTAGVPAALVWTGTQDIHPIDRVVIDVGVER